MATKVPITVDGNLAGDPEDGVSGNGTKWARFVVVVNDRRLNEQTNQWEDAGDPKFHRTAVFGRTADNVRDSLRKGNAVLVTGDLEFRTWNDKDTGEKREGTQIVADAVGPSLKYGTAVVGTTLDDPKVSGPDAAATGPVVTPAPENVPVATR